MMSVLKRIVIKLVSKTGYRIVPKRNKKRYNKDIALYKELYQPVAVEERRFYNVGAGRFYHPLWTNLDYVSDWYKKFQKGVIHFDLMEKGPLPVKANTAEVIYTSHTIEHIKDDAVKAFFIEAYKALKPGGIFRVTTGPDAESDYDAMIRGDHNWFYWDTWYEKPGTYEHIFHNPATSVSLEERWLHHVASQLAPNDRSNSNKIQPDKLRELIKTKSRDELLDYLTSLTNFSPERIGNHVSWWTHQKIEGLMREAGFEKIYRSGYGQSKCPILRNTDYFDNTHPQMSIYMEAQKKE